jgi:mRNA interferase RelE/StbE
MHGQLDIKKRIGQPLYRMRIGDWRVIFDMQDEIKVIAIEKIDSRGSIYK